MAESSSRWESSCRGIERYVDFLGKAGVKAEYKVTASDDGLSRVGDVTGRQRGDAGVVR